MKEPLLIINFMSWKLREIWDTEKNKTEKNKTAIIIFHQKEKDIYTYNIYW